MFDQKARAFAMYSRPPIRGRQIVCMCQLESLIGQYYMTKPAFVIDYRLTDYHMNITSIVEVHYGNRVVVFSRDVA